MSFFERNKTGFLLDMSVNTSRVSGCLFARRQTSNIVQLQNYSPPSDVSVLLKDDILLSSAKTGHYCSVTPAPPCINPMSVGLSAAGHMNSLEPHPERQSWLTLATATDGPNHFSDESVISWGSQILSTPLFHPESRVLYRSYSWQPFSHTDTDP